MSDDILPHPYVECTDGHLFNGVFEGPHCSAHCGRSKWDDIHAVPKDAPTEERAA